jgi:hypothetical protein
MKKNEDYSAVFRLNLILVIYYNVIILILIDLFGRFSNEILYILLNILPINDIFSLQSATHNLIPILQIRTDSYKYFQK